MVNYICSKCGKVFKQKGHYKAHINKKFPCDKNQSKNINNKNQLTKIPIMG